MTKAFRMAEVLTHSWLFGSVRYSTAGAVSIVELFGWGVYKRVGSVRSIAGITFVRDKADK